MTKSPTESARPQEYLGDSVYADFDGWHVVLTTENGAWPSNTIYLQPAVLSALFAYVRELHAEPLAEVTPVGKQE